MAQTISKVLLSASIIVCLSLAVRSQTSAPSPTPSIPAGTADEKSQQIINRAIAAVGGERYLSVRTVVGKGFYTPFVEGVSQIPARFLDYIIFPDHERTEFIADGIKTIQTNVGETGWVFDGGPKTIKEQGPQQVADFKRSMQTSIENLLRGWWQKEDGRVVYVGRREAGLARRNETVRLTYPSGVWIEFEFGANDGMPAKIIYKRSRKNMDTGDTEEATEEDQLLKPITIDGVTAPWVIDHFTNGKQTSRINYESVQYNQKLAESLFVKPENVKNIK
jgi:hypothetical protein